MKKFVTSLALGMFVFFSFNLQAQKVYTHANGKATVDNTRTSMTAIEKEMIKEINLVRTNPAGYAPYIQEYINKHALSQGEKDTGAAFIVELKKMTPRKALKEADCLLLAARDHAINQAPTGSLNHTDTNGKNPWDRVKSACSNMSTGNENLEGSASSEANYANDARKANCNLLIDHGIPGYGHRYNILNADWTHAGAFTYKDETGGTYMHRWIQKFGQAGSQSTAGSESSTTTPTTTAPKGTKPTSPCPASASGVESDFDNNWYLTTGNGKIVVTKECACKHFPDMCK